MILVTEVNDNFMKFKFNYVLYLVIILLIILFYRDRVKRKDFMKEEGLATIAKVYKKERRRKGSTTSQTVVYVEILNKEGEIERRELRGIANSSIRVGDCYRAVYVPEKPLFIDVEFSKKISCW